ncbi:hypothetical protein OS493_022203 [Desmophyllum pertusum]|uniref:Uncharacterized protein n=1 Tax=Desmophyllum pertusum TaxID=174260 RepID=A0A9W9YAP5_9CNID|nr:hypothetical protein OS493_022203 [Desmophyllum pertusum]
MDAGLMLKAASYAFDAAKKAFDNIPDCYFENEEIIGWWNDKKARDERALIEKTYENGRFSRDHYTLGLMPNGTWYCCFTQAGLRAKGHLLDDSGGCGCGRWWRQRRLRKRQQKVSSKCVQ